MKKLIPQKIASRINTKNDIFQKHQDQNQKLSTPMNYQQTHNALTIQKHVAVSFKDVETEETFSSNTRSQWKLPICDDNFFGQKTTTAQIRF